LAFINPGENVWSAKLPEDLKLNVKSAKMSQIYKRLHPDKPAYTITASGGGGTHGYHYAETRALTNRERARLQTFPDDFVFVGTTESVRKQIGMAVPPLLAKIIFESILKTYAGLDYESIASNIAINQQQLLWKESKRLKQYQASCA
jgi:DNA (cytosine-5)-methyltransferase 1